MKGLSLCMTYDICYLFLGVNEGLSRKRIERRAGRKGVGMGAGGLDNLSSMSGKKSPTSCVCSIPSLILSFPSSSKFFLSSTIHRQGAS